MFRDWKTTITAAFTALFAFIVFSPDLFSRWPFLIELAKFAAAGGLLAFGVAAKDSQK